MNFGQCIGMFGFGVCMGMFMLDAYNPFILIIGILFMLLAVRCTPE